MPLSVTVTNLCTYCKPYYMLYVCRFLLSLSITKHETITDHMVQTDLFCAARFYAAHPPTTRALHNFSAASRRGTFGTVCVVHVLHYCSPAHTHTHFWNCNYKQKNTHTHHKTTVRIAPFSVPQRLCCSITYLSRLHTSANICSCMPIYASHTHCSNSRREHVGIPFELLNTCL